MNVSIRILYKELSPPNNGKLIIEAGEKCIKFKTTFRLNLAYGADNIYLTYGVFDEHNLSLAI